MPSRSLLLRLFFRFQSFAVHFVVEYSIFLEFECLSCSSSSSSSSYAMTMVFSNDGKVLANKSTAYEDIFVFERKSLDTSVLFWGESPLYNWSDFVQNKFVISLVVFSSFKRSLFGIIQWSNNLNNKNLLPCCQHNHES